jgi:glutamate dehydrogenase (NADP+)
VLRIHARAVALYRYVPPHLHPFHTFFLPSHSHTAHHLGSDVDVPAGDIGTGGREIGFLFGAYKKYRNQFAGILTGKGGDWGGSFIRPEATGYGLVYFVTEMLHDLDSTDWKGKRVLISGSGNVAQYAALKVLELGGIVLSLSDSNGTLIATGDKGFIESDVEEIAKIKLARQSLTSFNAESRFKWVAGARPWTLFQKADIALPCASQNELNGAEAEALLAAGVRYVAEGSNMYVAHAIPSQRICWYQVSAW